MPNSINCARADGDCLQCEMYDPDSDDCGQDDSPEEFSDADPGL